MPADKTRSLRSIRTLGSLVDRRKARNRAGALIELSALAYEKELLGRELDRWARRQKEIEARLAEIREKETRLEQVAAAPPGQPRRRPPAVPDALRVTEFEY